MKLQILTISIFIQEMNKIGIKNRMYYKIMKRSL